MKVTQVFDKEENFLGYELEVAGTTYAVHDDNPSLRLGSIDTRGEDLVREDVPVAPKAKVKHKKAVRKPRSPKP